MYHIFFIHSSVDGHLGCFHVYFVFIYFLSSLHIWSVQYIIVNSDCGQISRNLFILRETLYTQNSNTHFPPWPQPLATTVLLSAYGSLIAFDVSEKWNRAMFVLLWLAYFT